jgi:Carboxypeptidase regulatory-like domain
MRSTRFFFLLIFLMVGTLAQAAQIAGTVTDKTTGKPAAGDQVVMLDVQAGMSEAAHATTDARGHYSMTAPGDGPYLVRVTHQGAGYFIAAPPGGGGSGDIPVYDVAAKVEGVRIEADVIEAESDNGQLKVNERYFVHNTSVPPVTQWSPRSFEVVLPPGAVLAGAGAQRPGGLPTTINLEPAGAKNHYAFNVPIEPDQGDKDTMFQISYSLPYPDDKFAFQSVLTMPADNLAVLLPKSMTFTPGTGASFKPVNEDPSVQTFLMRTVAANTPVAFTVSGEGSIPREAQGGNTGAGAQASNAPGGGPGGGIGVPIDKPDPLTKYKWWILGGVALLLITAAGFLLRRPAGTVAAAPEQAPMAYDMPMATVSYASARPTGKAALLNVLKEELFAIESEKIAGTLSGDEYAEQKAALETVLKRALKKA